MPVLGGGQYAGPVKLHDAATADADGGVLDVMSNSNGSYAVALFQISGTFTGTVHFEGTLDGENWVALEGVSVGVSATVATSAVASGAWRLNVIGLKRLRARLDWTSGTSVTVVAALVA